MNNYQIYDEIGKGRFSTVYKGRRKLTVDYYSIASISKDQRHRVMTSVQILRSLNHKNIIRFHNWYETKNHLWVITEYCTGGDLREILRLDERLSEASVRVFAGDIAEGLMFIHSKGLIYGDLKPSNMLMDSTATLRFYDFGLSVLFSKAREAPRIGTAAYMAPELFTSEGAMSMASDLWAFGCILYEMVTGAPPFVSKDLEKLVCDVLSKPLERIPKCSDVLNDLIESLLVKDPLQRATWGDVVSSDFWQGRLQLPTLPFPPQPAFEDYAQVQQRKPRGKPTAADFSEALAMVKFAKRNLVSADVSNAEDFLNTSSKVINCELDFSDRSAANGDQYQSPPTSRTSVSQPIPTVAVTAAAAPSATAGTSSGATSAPAAPPKAPSQRNLEKNNQQQQQPPQGQSHLQRIPSAKAPVKPLPAAGTHPPTSPHASNLTPQKGGGGTSATPQSRTADNGTRAQEPPKSAAVEPIPQPLAAGATSIGDLLLHSSDAHIRPLVMNHRIEKYVEQPVDAAALSFEAYGLKELKTFSSEQLEAFLTTVYRSLSASSVSYETKTNVVHYMESICCESAIANVMINSSVMTLCVRLAGQRASPVQFRASTANLMGILVRYATYIHEDLAKSDILPSILRVYKEEDSVRVRRKLIACIGELLFYVATQQEKDRPAWGMDPALVGTCYRAALTDEDDVLKHYAVKAIENISSIPDKSIARTLFANPVVVASLINVFALPPAATRTEHLRSSAACAAFKLAFADDSLIPIIFSSSHLGISTYAAAFDVRGSVKTPQMILSFASLALSKALVAVGNPFVPSWSNGTNSPVFASTSLSKEKGQQIIEETSQHAESMFSSLCDSSEHSSVAIRGKTLLLTLLIGSAEGRTMGTICQARYVTYIDRVSKDKDAYVQKCVPFLVFFLSSLITTRLKEIAFTTPPIPATTVGHYLQAVKQLLSAPNLHSHLEFGQDAMTSLSICVGKMRTPTSNVGQNETLLNAIVDLIARDSDLNSKNNHAAAIILAQPYIDMLGHTENERRFKALQMITSILLPVITDSGVADMANPSSMLYKSTSRSISSIGAKMSTLLKDTEPIPTYAVRLMGACGERFSSFVAPLTTDSFVVELLRYLSKSKDSALARGLRLLLVLLQVGSTDLIAMALREQVPARIMVALGAATSTGSAESAAEETMETCCELAALLLRRCTSGGTSSRNSISACQEFVKNGALLRLFMPACLSLSGSASESAAVCVASLVQLFPEGNYAVLSGEGISMLREALSDSKDTGAAKLSLLKALHHALKQGKKADAANAARDEVLMMTLQTLARDSSQSNELLSTARTIIDILKSLS